MAGSGRSGTLSDGDVTVAHEGLPRDTEVPKAGTVLGRYVVVEVIGEGGMGRVLRAYDPKLKREVALKLLRFRGDRASQARMVAEAQSMARLSHPNVLPVFDVDAEREHTFIAMEFVEGTTVRQWLEESERAWPEIVEVFAAAAEGLAAAHAAGVVHCDFKPANVLRGVDGRVRVMDFGLAALAVVDGHGRADRPSTIDDEQATEAVVMGTPVYMAPEQHEGTVDARSDQYAFGVSLWEALYGQRPFAGSSLSALVAAKRALQFDAPSRIGVPASLRKVLLQALAPDPEARFVSMDALLLALRKDPRHRRRIVAGVGALALGALGVQGWSMQRERAQQAACEEQGRSIDAVWGLERAQRVRVAFSEAPPAYAADAFVRMKPWLDRYAAAWSQLRTRACLVAPRDAKPQARPDATLACLEARRHSLEAFVDRLEDVDPQVVAMAVPGAARLPPVESCTDPSVLAAMPPEPEDPSTREALGRLRRRLAEVHALGQARRLAEAQALAETVLQDAEELAHPAARSEALRAAGRVARLQGRYADGRALTERAFARAAGSGLDALAAGTAVELTDVVGSKLAAHEVGLTWGRFAEAILERQGWTERPIQADLLGARGRILAERAQFDAARRSHEEALRIKRTHLGDDHPSVADSWSDLGNVAEESGDPDAAIEHHRRALALREAALGPEHPDVAATLNNLGNAHWGRGDLDIAAELLQRSAAIKRGAYGPDHASLISTVQNLGNVAYSQKDYAKAIASWQESLRIADVALPNAHPNRASLLKNLAAGHLYLEEYDLAQRYAEEALEVLTQVFGPTHVNLAHGYRILGAVQQGRGELGPAVEAIRQEVSLVLAEHGEHHLRTAESLRELGKMLLAGNQPREALVHLQRARDILVKLDGPAAARAVVEEKIAEASAQL